MRLPLIGLVTLMASPALACGPDTDCMIANDRTYRLYMPDTEGPVGAIFHAHGWRGTAAGAMRNDSLRDMADRLGMALVAMKSAGEDWDLAYRPREPDQLEAREYGYVANVIEDVATRIDLDRDRMVATGFSAGGMMTWTLACGMSDAFAGFVPYSGTFWLQPPETCPTPPTTIVHIHGTEDGVVPLGGRPIGETHQGDVYESFAMYSAHGGFTDAGTEDFPYGEDCTVQRGPSGELTLCLFTGGHSYSTARVEWAIERILGPS